MCCVINNPQLIVSCASVQCKGGVDALHNLGFSCDHDLKAFADANER